MGTGLAWENVGKDGSLLARSGKIAVGLVVVRSDGTVAWEIDGVSTKHVVEGCGETRTVTEGREAFERAWNVWLKHAGLAHATPEAPAGTAGRLNSPFAP